MNRESRRILIFFTLGLIYGVSNFSLECVEVVISDSEYLIAG